MAPPRPRPSPAVLAAVFLAVHGLFPHAAEANFWSERRDAARRQKGNPSSSPSLTPDHNQLLAQLPRTGQVAFGIPENASVGSGLSLSPSAGPDTQNLSGTSVDSPSWMSTLILPYGSIREVHLARPGAPIIVHIQDAHGIEEAQKNIAAMIQGLRETRGVDLVGVEGAEGAFDMESYRDWPDAAVTRSIAEYFLKEGKIGGPEFVGLTAPQPPVLWGVEDTELYLQNIGALRAAVLSKPAMKRALADLNAAIAPLKDAHYSPGLKEFDGHFRSYQEQKEGLGAYVRYLLGIHSGGASRFPNLALLMKALAAEGALDFKKVERERVSLVERLSGGLPRGKLDLLIQRSLQYRAGQMGYGDYHRFLQAFCSDNGIRLDDLQELKDYIAYVLLAEDIDRNALLDELSRAEKGAQDHLALTPEQKRLVAAVRRLVLLEKLSAQAMTPDDWSAYQAQREGVLGLAADLSALGGKPSEALSPGFLKPFEDFCGNAVRRNDAFIARLTERMRAQNASSSVLVAGGFHTDGLTRLMREQGLSYVVVTPKITEIPKDNNYLDVFARDPLPLEKLFAGEAIFLNEARRLAARSVPGFEDKAAELEATSSVTQAVAQAAVSAQGGDLSPDVARALSGKVERNTGGTARMTALTAQGGSADTIGNDGVADIDSKVLPAGKALEETGEGEMVIPAGPVRVRHVPHRPGILDRLMMVRARLTSRRGEMKPSSFPGGSGPAGVPDAASPAARPSDLRHGSAAFLVSAAITAAAALARAQIGDWPAILLGIATGVIGLYALTSAVVLASGRPQGPQSGFFSRLARSYFPMNIHVDFVDRFDKNPWRVEETVRSSVSLHRGWVREAWVNRSQNRLLNLLGWAFLDLPFNTLRLLALPLAVNHAGGRLLLARRAPRFAVSRWATFFLNVAKPLQLLYALPVAAFRAFPRSMPERDWSPGRIHVNPASRGAIGGLDLRLLVCDYDQTLEVNRFFQRGLERRVLYPLYLSGRDPSPADKELFEGQMSNRTQTFDMLYRWVRERRLDKTGPYPARDEVFKQYLSLAERELREGGEIAGTLQMIPHAIDLLSSLAVHRVSFVIATNDFASLKRKQILSNGLHEYFKPEDVYGLSDSGTEKPPKDRVILDSITAQGLSPNQVAMLGDTVTDVQAAKRAGVLSIALAESPAAWEALSAAGADVIIESDFRRREELLDLLFPRGPPSTLESLYQGLIDSQMEQWEKDAYSVMKLEEGSLRDLVKELVSELLFLHAKGEPVFLHPQGFLQLNVTDTKRWEISGGLRFHVWSPELPRPSQVLNRWHKHSFQSNSVVLLGEVHDGIFDVVPPEKGNDLQSLGFLPPNAAGHNPWTNPSRDINRWNKHPFPSNRQDLLAESSDVLRKYRTPLKGTNVPTDELVHVRRRLDRRASAGHRLHYPISDYHFQPYPSDVTATLFQKYDLNEKEHPAIGIGPRELPASEDLTGDRSFPQDQAWAVVLGVAARLAERYQLTENEIPGLKTVISIARLAAPLPGGGASRASVISKDPIPLIQDALQNALNTEDKAYLSRLRSDHVGVRSYASDLKRIEDHIAPAAAVRPEDRFLDAGSGIGIVPLYFSMKFGIPAGGVELDEGQHRISEKIRRYLIDRGHLSEEQVSFARQDLLETDFSPYSAIYYHSPFFEDVRHPVNQAVLRGVIEKMPSGGRWIDTMLESRDVMESLGEGFTVRKISDGDDLVEEIYAHVYTKGGETSATLPSTREYLLREDGPFKELKDYVADRPDGRVPQPREIEEDPTIASDLKARLLDQARAYFAEVSRIEESGIDVSTGEEQFSWGAFLLGRKPAVASAMAFSLAALALLAARALGVDVPSDLPAYLLGSLGAVMLVGSAANSVLFTRAHEPGKSGARFMAGLLFNLAAVLPWVPVSGAAAIALFWPGTWPLILLGASLFLWGFVAGKFGLGLGLAEWAHTAWNSRWLVGRKTPMTTSGKGARRWFQWGDGTPPGDLEAEMDAMVSRLVDTDLPGALNVWRRMQRLVTPAAQRQPGLEDRLADLSKAAAVAEAHEQGTPLPEFQTDRVHPGRPRVLSLEEFDGGSVLVGGHRLTFGTINGKVVLALDGFHEVVSLLRGETVTIGRGPDGAFEVRRGDQVVLSGGPDRLTSFHRHASIRLADVRTETFWNSQIADEAERVADASLEIVDLGSTNGTRVGSAGPAERLARFAVRIAAIRPRLRFLEDRAGFIERHPGYSEEPGTSPSSLVRGLSLLLSDALSDGDRPGKPWLVGALEREVDAVDRGLADRSAWVKRVFGDGVEVWRSRALQTGEPEVMARFERAVRDIVAGIDAGLRDGGEASIKWRNLQRNVRLAESNVKNQSIAEDAYSPAQEKMIGDSEEALRRELIRRAPDLLRLLVPRDGQFGGTVQMTGVVDESGRLVILAPGQAPREGLLSFPFGIGALDLRVRVDRNVEVPRLVNAAILRHNRAVSLVRPNVMNPDAAARDMAEMNKTVGRYGWLLQLQDPGKKLLESYIFSTELRLGWNPARESRVLREHAERLSQARRAAGLSASDDLLSEKTLLLSALFLASFGLPFEAREDVEAALSGALSADAAVERIAPGSGLKDRMLESLPRMRSLLTGVPGSLSDAKSWDDLRAFLKARMPPDVFDAEWAKIAAYIDGRASSPNAITRGKDTPWAGLRQKAIDLLRESGGGTTSSALHAGSAADAVMMAARRTAGSPFGFMEALKDVLDDLSDVAPDDKAGLAGALEPLARGGAMLALGALEPLLPRALFDWFERRYAPLHPSEAHPARRDRLDALFQEMLAAPEFAALGLEGVEVRAFTGDHLLEGPDSFLMAPFIRRGEKAVLYVHERMLGAMGESDLEALARRELLIQLSMSPAGGEMSFDAAHRRVLKALGQPELLAKAGAVAEAAARAADPEEAEHAGFARAFAAAYLEQDAALAAYEEAVDGFVAAHGLPSESADIVKLFSDVREYELMTQEMGARFRPVLATLKARDPGAPARLAALLQGMSDADLETGTGAHFRSLAGVLRGEAVESSPAQDAWRERLMAAHRRLDEAQQKAWILAGSFIRPPAANLRDMLSFLTNDSRDRVKGAHSRPFLRRPNAFSAETWWTLDALASFMLQAKKADALPAVRLLTAVLEELPPSSRPAAEVRAALGVFSKYGGGVVSVQHQRGFKGVREAFDGFGEFFMNEHFVGEIGKMATEAAEEGRPFTLRDALSRLEEWGHGDAPFAQALRRLQEMPAAGPEALGEWVREYDLGMEEDILLKLLQSRTQALEEGLEGRWAFRALSASIEKINRSLESDGLVRERGDRPRVRTEHGFGHYEVGLEGRVSREGAIAVIEVRLRRSGGLTPEDIETLRRLTLSAEGTGRNAVPSPFAVEGKEAVARLPLGDFHISRLPGLRLALKAYPGGEPPGIPRTTTGAEGAPGGAAEDVTAAEMDFLRQIVGESRPLDFEAEARVRAALSAPAGVVFDDVARRKARAALEAHPEAAGRLALSRFEAQGREAAELSSGPLEVDLNGFETWTAEERAQRAAWLAGAASRRAAGTSPVVVTTSGSVPELQKALRAAGPALAGGLPVSLLFISDAGLYDPEGRLNADVLVESLQTLHGLPVPSLIIAVEGKVNPGQWADRVKTFESIAQVVKDWIDRAVYLALQA